MHERERAIRRARPGVRIRKLLSMERLESRAMLAGLVNLGESLLELPAASQGSPPVIVAPLETPTADVAVVEPTPPPSEQSLPSSVRPEVGDSILGNQQDREDGSSDDPLDGASDDLDCDPGPFEQQDQCPAFKLESGTSYMGSQDAWVQVAVDPSNESLARDGGGRDRSMISLRDTPLSDGELKSSMLAGTSTAKLIDKAMSFRYFTDSGDSHRDGWMTLKSEPLAPYAMGDTFVAFELMDAHPHQGAHSHKAHSHDAHSHQGADERPGDAQRPTSRRVAFRSELPLPGLSKDGDRVPDANPAMIAEAEAAIALAQQIAEEADAARAENAPVPAVATVVESTADSRVAFTSPASSCDNAKPGRQPAFSLPGSLRFGLLGVASIVISMGASSSSSLRRRTPDDPISGEDAESGDAERNG